MNNVRDNKYALNIFLNNLLIVGIGLHKKDDGYQQDAMQNYLSLKTILESKST